MPDLFVLDDRKIILVREVGAAAFSRDDGRLLFSERIDGGLLFTNDYLTNRYSECVQSLVMSSKKNIGGQQAGTNIPKFHTSDAFYKMALAQKQYIYSSTESAMRSGSRAERASAIGKRSMATNAALGQAQIQAYADLMQASSQIGAGIGLVIAKAIAVKLDATVQPHNEESMKFMLSEIAHSQTIHNYSIQGNFYIRPYYKEGWKLALVDLNNGNRADIILHPPNEALVFAANLPAFAMDPGGKNLIVKGLGIDSNRYETHELICHEDIVRDPYAGRNFTIPYPSLLFYDVSRFKYVKNEIRNIPPGIAHAINTQNADLISAAFYGDFETVVKLLNKGADINAVDEYGHTALMHATQILNDGMIKLLLERGADITIVDDNGLTAYDYIFLPITKISNENLVPVVKLFMKASKNLKNKE